MSDHDHPVPAAASAYIANGDKPLMIAGKPVPSVSGETFEVIDPTTEKVLCRVASANAEDVDRAVRAARRAFEAGSWAAISPAERARYLLKIADLIEQHADELGALQSIEMGAPFKQTRAMAIGQAEIWRYSGSVTASACCAPSRIANRTSLPGRSTTPATSRKRLKPITLIPHAKR